MFQFFTLIIQVFVKLAFIVKQIDERTGGSGANGMALDTMIAELNSVATNLDPLVDAVPPATPQP